MPRSRPDHRTALPRGSAAGVRRALQHAPASLVTPTAAARRPHSPAPPQRPSGHCDETASTVSYTSMCRSRDVTEFLAPQADRRRLRSLPPVPTIRAWRAHHRLARRRHPCSRWVAIRAGMHRPHGPATAGAPVVVLVVIDRRARWLRVVRGLRVRLGSRLRRGLRCRLRSSRRCRRRRRARWRGRGCRHGAGARLAVPHHAQLNVAALLGRTGAWVLRAHRPVAVDELVAVAHQIL